MDYWDRPSRPLREIPRDGDNHAFLIKALHEAGNELEGEFYGLRPRQLTARLGSGWSLKQIAGHLRDKEELTLSYVRAIISSRKPRLDVVDLEALVDDGDYDRLDLHEALYGYSDCRQNLLYLLHDLSQRQWERTGEHPYRGALSVGQLVRELNEHDLAHLWQVQRIKQALF
jgi:hypothetical protein